MAEEVKGRWVTMRGRRVFIKDGESVADAINRSIAKSNDDIKEKQIARAKEVADRLNGKKPEKEEPKKKSRREPGSLRPLTDDEKAIKTISKENPTYISTLTNQNLDYTSSDDTTWDGKFRAKVDDERLNKEIGKHIRATDSFFGVQRRSKVDLPYPEARNFEKLKDVFKAGKIENHEFDRVLISDRVGKKEILSPRLNQIIDEMKSMGYTPIFAFKNTGNGDTEVQFIKNSKLAAGIGEYKKRAKRPKKSSNVSYNDGYTSPIDNLYSRY